MDVWRCRQITEDQPQRVIGPNLIVTVPDDEENRESADSPSQEAQKLQCGSVGPMGIFADNDRRARPGGERRKYLPKEPIPGIALEGRLVDVDAKGRCQITDRTERSGRREGVARGPQQLRDATDLAAERLDQCGLAHPGFAANEHHASVPRSGLAQMLLELIQVGFALQELHRGAFRGSRFMIRPGAGSLGLQASEHGLILSRSSSAISTTCAVQARMAEVWAIVWRHASLRCNVLAAS